MDKRGKAFKEIAEQIGLLLIGKQWQHAETATTHTWESSNAPGWVYRL